MENVWVIQGRSPREHGQVRVIVYEMQDKSEDVFEIDSVEMEQHERAEADKHLHSRANLDSSNPCVGYHFEYRDAGTLK